MSMKPVEDHPLRAIAFMLGAVFLFSTMDVAFKQLVAHYSSVQVAFLRCVLSAPLFAVWILARDPRLFRTGNWRMHGVRALFALGMLVAVGESFRELPLADAYAIFFAAPLLITLLSGPLMREPAGAARTAAGLIGFLGVLVVLKPGAGTLVSYGSAMALVAVACYTGVVFLLRSLGRHEHSVTIAFWYTALVALLSGSLLIGRWQALRADDWPWLVLLGIAGTVGQVMITAAYRRAPAAVIAPLDYVHMFWAVLYGWWLWGDLPGARVWTGTAVVVACGLFIMYRERRQVLAARARGAGL